MRAPAELSVEGRAAGLLTSCATYPDGRVLGLGLVKRKLAEAEAFLVASVAGGLNGGAATARPR